MGQFTSWDFAQDDDAELSDLFYAMQAIEMLPRTRSFSEVRGGSWYVLGWPWMPPWSSCGHALAIDIFMEFQFWNHAPKHVNSPDGVFSTAFALSPIVIFFSQPRWPCNREDPGRESHLPASKTSRDWQRVLCSEPSCDSHWAQLYLFTSIYILVMDFWDGQIWIMAGAIRHKHVFIVTAFRHGCVVDLSVNPWKSRSYFIPILWCVGY